MKINEKNLCAYAVSSNVAPDKEGYLMKKGEANKGFQKRWFVLKGNLLFYFEKRLDKEPIGVVILEGCTIELDENDAQFSFKIVFHGAGNRSYILCAESQESMEQWMKSLACASYDYMKLMVTELQRQLKEAHSHKGSDKPSETESHNMFVHEDLTNLLTLEDNHNGYSSLSSRTSSLNSSPHPPPRNRQHHKSQAQTQSAATGGPRMKSASSSAIASQYASNQSTQHFTYVNQRSKISFKDIHTAFGRPVLSDRNFWRHQKKLNAQSTSSSVTEEKKPQLIEQNLLISL